MQREQIDNLIVMLLAIANYAKDIHYNCSGPNFYGNHLFADRIQENLYEYIDQLKEVCLLGHDIKPLHSSIYLARAAQIVPEGSDFESMRTLMINALIVIEEVNNLSKGDENLIGAIAQDIQNNVGLLTIMLSKAGDM